MAALTSATTTSPILPTGSLDRALGLGLFSGESQPEAPWEAQNGFGGSNNVSSSGVMAGCLGCRALDLTVAFIPRLCRAKEKSLHFVLFSSVRDHGTKNRRWWFMEFKEFSWTGLGREAKAQRSLRKSHGDRMCLGICEIGHVCLFNPSESPSV